MPKSASSTEREPEDIPKKRPKARTRERRAQQLVDLAEDLIEERMRKGTASPTEVTAVLRLGSEEAMLNLERLKAQTAYLKAQQAKAEAETVNEQMMNDAIKAMGIYNPNQTS